MTLVPAIDIVAAATARGTAAGAFNVIQLEHAEALVHGAEHAHAPIILQISENCVRYHGALEPLATAVLAIARTATVPVGIHLDHVETATLIDEAIELGIHSVMFDGSRLPDDDNVAATAATVRECHARGVAVEAELGEIGGKDGVHAPGARTDPAQATAFVTATGVDTLAVAVGSSHAMTTRKTELDLLLISQLHDAVPVPLVLHGSSGVPDDGLRAAVAAGMRKINIATHINKVFSTAARHYLAGHPEVTDTRKWLAPARDAITTETTRLLRDVLGWTPPTP